MRVDSCWILSEGHAGVENQCLGLAEAVGVAPTVKRVRPRAPWTYLPARLWPAPLMSLPAAERLAPPWPDLVITCGRRSVPLSVAVRRASGGATFTVHIQDPTVDPRNFDLVVAPRHDRLTGDNVVVTRGAVHRVTPARLAAAARDFAPRLSHLPRPLVAVLVGGTNRRYRVTPEIMAGLARRLAVMARLYGAGLAVTPSRRTGRENEAALRRGLDGVPAAIWDGDGGNPYFAYLALADAIVVTCDSVSMVSEALSTGKPVYVADLPGGSPRFRRFHEGLRRDGLVRPFTGRLEPWTYTPLDDTARAAGELRRRLEARRRRTA